MFGIHMYETFPQTYNDIINACIPIIKACMCWDCDFTNYLPMTAKD